MTTYHYISESVPKFRVGGVYRQNSQTVVRLAAMSDQRHIDIWAERLPGRLLGEARNVEDGYPKGYIRLDDGVYVGAATGLNHPQDLIPGELHQVNGQWVPLEQTASLTFPGGGCVQLAGEKVIGRTAPEPVRAPLDWNTTTKHDTFGPDFIVTKGEVPTAPLYDSPTTHGAYPAIAGLLLG